MPAFFLDFETRSQINLKTAGAYRYAEDASTEALCAGWAIDHGPVTTWKRGQAPDWLVFLHHPEFFIVAHNAEFERLILKHVFKLDLPASKFRCTAALTARYGLPRSLDQAGQALGLTHLKDKGTGARVIHKLCKPRRPSKTNRDAFWEEDTASEDFDDLYEYNEGDIEAMREIYYILPPLSETEQALWELTVRMNDRGLNVDLHSVRLAHTLAEEEQDKLAKRWQTLVGVPLNSPKAAAALTARYGIAVESVAKMPLRHLLRRTDLPPAMREALGIRKVGAKASVAKLAKLQQMTCRDGRYRGGLVYSGAERTQRWTARGVQVHNLPIGLGKQTDVAFDGLGLGILALMYENPLVTISEMLKGFFTGPFLIGDFSQIEARSLAWFAKQNDLVEMFAKGEDVYCDMASTIYGSRITKKDFDEELRIAKRQLGKIAVLGCGYGLGAVKLQRQLDEKFDILVDDERAMRVISAYRGKYPKVPAFWTRLETLFRTAIQNPGQRLSMDGFHAGTRDFAGRHFAYLQLPSGRPLWYFNPKADIAGTWPSGDPKLSLGYFGRDLYTKKWQITTTYGGKLTENATQAFARDLMAWSMLRLDRAGFPLVLDVHDEVVAQAPADGLEEYTRIMKEVPPWAEGLPLEVESFASERYHK